MWRLFTEADAGNSCRISSLISPDWYLEGLTCLSRYWMKCTQSEPQLKHCQKELNVFWTQPYSWFFFFCAPRFPRCKIGGFKKAIISLCYCACRSCFPSMLFYLAKLEDFSGWQTWRYERNALLLQFGLCKTHTYIIDYKYYAWTLLKCHYKAIGKYFTFTENRISTTAIAKSPIKRDFSVCTVFRAI